MREELNNTFEWNLGTIRKQNRRTVFKKGFKPYIVLIVIVFIFSFIGVSYTSATKEISVADTLLGLGDKVQLTNLDMVNDYVCSLPMFSGLTPKERATIVEPAIASLAKSQRVLVNFLSLNRSYVKRNVGEVFGLMIVFMALFSIISFILQNVAQVGQQRFVMENCFNKDVKIRRIFAPFGNKKFRHILWVTIKYNVVLLLWGLTVVGGVIKFFQYLFVPNILAENPDVTWKEARDLSKQMTKGYKWKMFVARLSYIYLDIAGILIPCFELFVGAPITLSLDSIMYFTLRRRDDIDRSLFIERAFDGPFYCDQTEEERVVESDFALSNVKFKHSNFDKADKYKITEIIVMFMLFCFIGWVWEVSLHLVQHHEFVNRGTMYGPWIPIYGTGGVLIIVLLSRLKGSKPKLFITTMILCGVLEYITSFVLDYFQNSEYWNYDNMFANINGRVCLAGLVAFALGGFLGIYIVGPMIKAMLEKFGTKKTRILCIILASLFIIDLICVLIFGPNSGKGVGGVVK